jgi:hypothetical protein
MLLNQWRKAPLKVMSCVQAAFSISSTLDCARHPACLLAGSWSWERAATKNSASGTAASTDRSASSK